MIDLRWYQDEAVSVTFDFLRTNKEDEGVIVAPTGAGKSIIISAINTQLLTKWEHLRVIVCSHVAELVEQDYNAQMRYWKRSPAGIYSAGLGKRDTRSPIVFATIQSVVKKAHVLGHRDLMIIDEAHLLSHKDDGVYKRFIAAMREINPKMRVLGLTATPYRLDVGMITEGEGRIFSKIIYEIPVKTLVDEGSLTPLTSFCTKALQLETEGIRITGGEFNADDMAEKYEELIEPICDDIAVKAAHRKSILVFVPRVDIASKFVDALNNRGMYAESLDGSAKKPERKSIIKRFKDGDIRVLVSVNILTTGFDAPNVDCVVLARATVSAGLYYQIIGRGMRLDENKPDCLVLDYGGNIRRHGAVTNIKPPRNKTACDIKKEEKEEEDEARTKTCEDCGFVHTPVYPDDCLHCGKPLPKASSDPKADNYKSKADNIDPMHGEVKVSPPAQWMTVNSWDAKVHQKHGKTPSLQVTYHTDFLSVNEWVYFEHIGFAGQKSRAWYRKMRDNALQDSEASFGGQLTCKDVLEYDFRHLRCPDKIKVKEDGKWHRVLDYRFNQVIAQQEEYDQLDDIVF
jgi:DNA repair protein RadD